MLQQRPGDDARKGQLASHQGTCSVSISWLMLVHLCSGWKSGSARFRLLVMPTCAGEGILHQSCAELTAYAQKLKSALKAIVWSAVAMVKYTMNTRRPVHDCASVIPPSQLGCQGTLTVKINGMP